MKLRQKEISIRRELKNNNGSQNCYYNPIAKEINYSDGVKNMVKLCESYWMLTDILIIIKSKFLKNDFISIKLYSNIEDDKCKIIYDDGNNNILFEQHYPFTDFPLFNIIKKVNDKEILNPAITLFYSNNILYLPSEH